MIKELISFHPSGQNIICMNLIDIQVKLLVVLKNILKEI